VEKMAKSMKRQGMKGLVKVDERERKLRGQRELAKVELEVIHPNSYWRPLELHWRSHLAAKVAWVG